jgi:hypothetical protein
MIAYIQLLNEALCITLRAESRVIRAKDSEIEQKDGEIAALRAAFPKHEDTLSAIRQTNCEEKRLFELLTLAQQSCTAELEQRRIFEVGHRRSAHVIYVVWLVFQSLMLFSPTWQTHSHVLSDTNNYMHTHTHTHTHA